MRAAKANSELERILLVEDDPDIQLVAGLSLEDIGGFRVVICSSGIEALEKVEQFRPQLILLDVMMPEMDGISTLAELRRQPVASETPVVFMTAKAQPDEIAEYRRLGAVDVIVKPFDPLFLSREVQAIWQRCI